MNCTYVVCMGILVAGPMPISISTVLHVSAAISSGSALTSAWLRNLSSTPIGCYVRPPILLLVAEPVPAGGRAGAQADVE
jgi:hypothetical protein